MEINVKQKKYSKKEIDFFYILFLRKNYVKKVSLLLLVGCNIKMEQFIPYYAI